MEALATQEMFLPAPPSTMATGSEATSARNVASESGELHFKLYLILITLNLYLRNHKWLMDTVLDCTAL